MKKRRPIILYSPLLPERSLREENLKQIEELLQTALEKAKLAGVSVDELCEILKAL